MSRIPEPYELYDRYSAEQERALQKRPICCKCREHIQDDVYEIEGEYYCDDCARDWLYDQIVEVDE